VAFAVTVAHDADITVLRLGGELDLAATAQLNTHIDQLIAAGRHRLLLDLGSLRFCDSTGLSAFIRGDNACTQRGGWLRLAGQRGHVARVLDLIGLTETLQYRPDVAAGSVTEPGTLAT
jgi:anti-sigma B factor antagonist